MPARCDDTLMNQQGELHDPGQVILDRYELLRVLGSGGWGRVYLANDQLLNRLVAIKQLVPRLAADSAAVNRFKREASAVASIRDPYVLTIHDIYECGAQHYMVMEYADAGTLAQRMRLEGVLPPYEAMSVAIDICKGLRAIHLKGIIHRDVKPANVMFFSRPDTVPVAKLGDLGIALQQEEGERLTPSDGPIQQEQHEGGKSRNKRHNKRCRVVRSKWQLASNNYNKPRTIRMEHISSRLRRCTIRSNRHWAGYGVDCSRQSE